MISIFRAVPFRIITGTYLHLTTRKMSLKNKTDENLNNILLKKQKNSKSKTWQLSTWIIQTLLWKYFHFQAHTGPWSKLNTSDHLNREIKWTLRDL